MAPKRSARLVSWWVMAARRFLLLLDEDGRFVAFLPLGVTVAIVWPESDSIRGSSPTGSLADLEDRALVRLVADLVIGKIWIGNIAIWLMILYPKKFVNKLPVVYILCRLKGWPEEWKIS